MRLVTADAISGASRGDRKTQQRHAARGRSHAAMFSAGGHPVMQTSGNGRVQGTRSCFSAFDRADVPRPVEDASEAAWREFDACWEALERRVVDQGWTTRGADPWTHEPRGKAAAHRTTHEPAGALQVDDVMRLARANDRVCP